MKPLFAGLFFVCCMMHITYAQDSIPSLDKSPMDMSYYPANYPVLKVQDKASEPLIARVIYGRPSKNGRKIFGELLEYGKVWRLGANEATEIEFYRDMQVNNVRIKKGRYTLFAIPFEDKWTIIINRETDTWGSFKYNSKKDIVRMDVAVEKLPGSAESFTIFFEKAPKGISLQIRWEDIKVVFPFSTL